MSHCNKRYRQTSILESFSSSKRPKVNVMDDTRDLEQTMHDPTVNVSASKNETVEEKTEDMASENMTCQAANDSMNIKHSDSIIDKLWDTGENGYKSSADLFSEESPMEDLSVPSSSNSKDLFPDSEPSNSEKEECESQPSHSTPMEITESSESESDETDYVRNLNRSPDCRIPLPKLELLENHSIMFSYNIQPGVAPRPFPRLYSDKWNTDYVLMPCSPQNRYPAINSRGESRIISRWDIICRSLKADIGSSKDLQDAIMKYNTHYNEERDFNGLHAFMSQHWREEEREHFFEVIFPRMVDMALSLPQICTQPIPLLKRGKDHSITLSQKQIGCLLLNAFFCTFPRRHSHHRKSKNKMSEEFATYPSINFQRLFFPKYGRGNEIIKSTAEKLKCLFNYFRRIVFEEPTGTVTFHRQVVKNHNLPLWHTTTRGIRTAIIKSKGLIETNGQGMLQVDFANKFVGGGVLGQGCVQEEIRFVVCPELIVSRLFVERLDANEVLIVTGAEQYNKYSGYSQTFKWEGDFKDDIPRDAWGRRCKEIVAMDATSFRNPADQFTIQSIKRELNKAYCAFYENTPPVHLPAVATGNWGCGAFKGCPKLKFLIQLMAASETGRSILYFTFENKKLKKELDSMYEFLNNKNLTVGDVWRLLMQYVDAVSLNQEKSDLYHFIFSQFSSKKNSEPKSDANSNELTDSCQKAAELLFDEVAADNSLKDMGNNT